MSDNHACPSCGKRITFLPNQDRGRCPNCSTAIVRSSGGISTLELKPPTAIPQPNVPSAAAKPPSHPSQGEDLGLLSYLWRHWEATHGGWFMPSLLAIPIIPTLSILKPFIGGVGMAWVAGATLALAGICFLLYLIRQSGSYLLGGERKVDHNSSSILAYLAYTGFVLGFFGLTPLAVIERFTPESGLLATVVSPLSQLQQDLGIAAISSPSEAQGDEESQSDPKLSGSPTSSNTPTYEFPPELTDQKKWPDLPLTKVTTQLASERNDHTIPHPFFSPLGHFLVTVHFSRSREGDVQQDVRLWKVASGERHVAESPECDYFSLPAAFSPDESRLACLDGEFLRIWSITSTPAVLLQSVRMPGAPLAPPPGPGPLTGGEAAPLPRSTYDDVEPWNSISWLEDGVIILSIQEGVLRQEGEGVRTCQILRQSSGAFEPDGGVHSATRTHKGKGTSYSTIAVSPDAKHLIFAVEPELNSYQGRLREIRDAPATQQHLVIQVVTIESGSEVKELIFPGCRHSDEHFPSAMLVSGIEEDLSSFVRWGACIDFTPDGRFLLVAKTDESNPRTVTVVDTSTWQPVAELDFDESYQPKCYSQDGNYLAGLTIHTTRTSRGRRVERIAIIHDLRTGKQSRTELGDDFVVDEQGGPRINLAANRAAQEKVSFSADGKSLIVAVVKKNHWAVGSWSVSEGSRLFSVVRQELGPYSPNAIKLINGGHIAVTLSPLQVWDIPHLVSLRSNLDEGDRLWAAGKRSDAFIHYCSVLADSMAWFVEADLPRAYSRCIDVFAEQGEVAKGRSLVLQAQRSKMLLSAETAAGKGLIEDFISEIAEARSREAERKGEAEAKRIADIRAKNQRLRVPSNSMTKNQFIEKLKATMNSGQIDNMVISAFYTDNAFQDVFGEPDSNVEWVNGGRLISYRCRDGVIQLKVAYSGSLTVLHGINQY